MTAGGKFDAKATADIDWAAIAAESDGAAVFGRERGLLRPFTGLPSMQLAAPAVSRRGVDEVAAVGSRRQKSQLA